MSLSLRRGRVTAIRERLDGLVRLDVDGVDCVAYPSLTGPVALEDEVLVNVQARELGLGSGGFDVLYANLTRGLDLAPEEGAHVMVLPYTPLQHARVHVEEAGDPSAELAGMPVVCCSLHSQVAPVCAALEGLRVAYVQLGGGALPVSLSDTLRVLEGRGLVDATAAVAPCFDADVQCVSVASALGWARGEHDVAVCAIGPGIVGTGTRFGHGGLAAAEAANTALALGGVPVVAERVSGADERTRHRGISHHTEAVLALVRGEPVVAAMHGDGWREACAGLPLSHMGRGPDEDPKFFAAAYSAGLATRELLG
ncbi:MAG TPA: DUF3866 family protein [Gaiellaceae bacterium]|nr:DUF3866 family protein [Gaiellaceae bacterium]